MLFMSNPFSMFIILALYLMFILKWGPQLMENRKPYNLNKIIIAYNIIQIIACARLVSQVSLQAIHCCFSFSIFLIAIVLTKNNKYNFFLFSIVNRALCTFIN